MQYKDIYSGLRTHTQEYAHTPIVYYCICPYTTYITVAHTLMHVSAHTPIVHTYTCITTNTQQLQDTHTAVRGRQIYSSTRTHIQQCEEEEEEDTYIATCCRSSCSSSSAASYMRTVQQCKDTHSSTRTHIQQCEEEDDAYIARRCGSSCSSSSAASYIAVCAT